MSATLSPLDCEQRTNWIYSPMSLLGFVQLGWKTSSLLRFLLNADAKIWTARKRALKASGQSDKFEARAEARPAVAIVTPVPAKPTLASIEPQLQRRRDDDRRRILDQELRQEEESLGASRDSLLQEQQNPTLIAAVRVAQQTTDPTPSQLLEIRSNLDKASGRIRGLQATVSEHEKNIEALKKELGALKP